MINETFVMPVSSLFSRVMLWVMLVFQVAFWFYSRGAVARYQVTPRPISDSALNLLSFGDRQLLFRVLALHLQSYGDRFGRYNSLDEYNYDYLKQWFFGLSRMDERSGVVPYIATSYYGAAHKKENVVSSIEYLKWYSQYNVDRDGVNYTWKWQSLYHVALWYYFKLSMVNEAIEASKGLLSYQDIPLWAYSFPVGIMYKVKRYCGIIDVVKSQEFIEKFRVTNLDLLNLKSQDPEHYSSSPILKLVNHINLVVDESGRKCER